MTISEFRIAQNEYIAECTASLGQKTVKDYSAKLKSFSAFLNTIGNNTEISRDTMLAYLKYMTDSGNLKTTRYAKWNIIDTFFDWCIRCNKISNNPCARIKVRHGNPQPKNQLSEEEFDILLNRPPTLHVGNYKRNHRIIKTLLGTGLRESELAALNVEDFYGNKLVVRHGKGDKSRILPLSPDVAMAITEQITDADGNRRDAYDPIFCSKCNRSVGQRLDGSGINRVVKNYTRMMIGREVTAHQLRAAYAGRLLSVGADLKTVQYALGHDNISTTSIYAYHYNQKRTLEKKISEAFPMPEQMNTVSYPDF